jgi:hypothetical protein
MPENTNLILLASYAGSLFSFGRNAKGNKSLNEQSGGRAETAERQSEKALRRGELRLDSGAAQRQSASFTIARSRMRFTVIAFLPCSSPIFWKLMPAARSLRMLASAFCSAIFGTSRPSTTS